MPFLRLPSKDEFLIVQTDASKHGWAAVLYAKPNEFSPANSERICRYASGKFKEKGMITALEAELMAVTYVADPEPLNIIPAEREKLKTINTLSKLQ